MRPSVVAAQKAHQLISGDCRTWGSQCRADTAWAFARAEAVVVCRVPERFKEDSIDSEEQPAVLFLAHDWRVRAEPGYEIVEFFQHGHSLLRVVASADIVADERARNGTSPPIVRGEV